MKEKINRNLAGSGTGAPRVKSVRKEAARHEADEMTESFGEGTRMYECM